MALPDPAPRRPLHTRRVTCQGFLREDGLWDLEGELRDTKSYVYEDRERGALPVGDAMHGMKVRITVDNDLVVKDIHTDMADIPFQHCAGATQGAPALVGKTIGPGWRQAVDAQMKGVKGCSHMRELLYAVATAAFQTISPYREQFMKELGAPKRPGTDDPFFLDQCYSWDRRSPVVMRFYPKSHHKA
ncbi:MAG: hypothetical protein JWP52_4015 [Rhizobacter sp.]|jgi:hypothetical protein|nr:hypothetical protein [Rhizobacter sp.]